MLLSLLTAVYAATLNVGSGGYATIQAAVDAASSGDTIAIGPGTWDGGVDLRGRDVDIVSTDGADRTLIDLSETGFTWDQGEGGRLEGFTILANGYRAFVLVESEVEIVDVEVEGAGDGGDRGGAVSVSGGAPVFERVRFEDSSGSRGGTFYIVEGAAVQLIDVEIQGSSAGYGGAIYLEAASLDASGLTIEQVEVENTGGGFYLAEASMEISDLTLSDITGQGTFGAGIYAGDRSEILLDGALLDRCSISELDDDYAGGGVYLEGDSQLSASGITFRENLSTDGGALAADDSVIELSDAHFEDSEALRRGGAVYLTDESQLTCDGCAFEDNTAEDGGALYAGGNTIFAELSGGEWLDNTASGSGGALAAEGAYQIELAGAVFESNEAEELGGALYLSDLYLSVSIRSAEFVSNQAYNEEGGAIAAEGTTQLQISESEFSHNESREGGGGAIWFAPDSERDLEIEDSILESNTSDADGGAVQVIGGGQAPDPRLRDRAE